MRLPQDQIEKYRKDGFLLLEDVFNTREITLMLQEMVKVVSEDCPRRILEKNGVIRSFFAPEHDNKIFDDIIRSKRLVEPASQLVGTEIYVHQTKLNTKQAIVGDWWEWHRDYTFWKLDDGMPRPDVLTAMVYLNDVNEFNGPLLLIPGSHKEEDLDDEVRCPGKTDTDNEWFSEYQASTSYMSALTSDLKYTLKRYAIEKWVKKTGIRSAQAPAGSVLFFHGNIFHASSNNLSPWDRHAFLISYNSVDNALPEIKDPRPEFIARRDFTPVVPVTEFFEQSQ